MSVVEKRRFINVEVGENMNRFWDVELHSNDDVITYWGRVGVNITSKTFAGAGRRELSCIGLWMTAQQLLGTETMNT